MKTGFRIQDMAIIALDAALLCVLAPLAIPAGPVPFTLATLAVYLCAAVTGMRRGTLSVLLYILIGAVGVPVFSGFAGGVQKLIGLTGGYLAGYVLCVVPDRGKRHTLGGARRLRVPVHSVRHPQNRAGHGGRLSRAPPAGQARAFVKKCLPALIHGLRRKIGNGCADISGKRCSSSSVGLRHPYVGSAVVPNHVSAMASQLALF